MSETNSKQAKLEAMQKAAKAYREKMKTDPVFKAAEDAKKLEKAKEDAEKALLAVKKFKEAIQNNQSKLEKAEEKVEKASKKLERLAGKKPNTEANDAPIATNDESSSSSSSESSSAEESHVEPKKEETKRTVKCGSCGKEGHTKRTCPDAKK